MASVYLTRPMKSIFNLNVSRLKQFIICPLQNNNRNNTVIRRLEKLSIIRRPR